MPRPRFDSRRPRERSDEPRSPAPEKGREVASIAKAPETPPRAAASPVSAPEPRVPAPPRPAAPRPVAAPPPPAEVSEKSAPEPSNIGATLVGVPLPKAQSKVEKERPRTAKEALAAKTRAVAKTKPASKRDPKPNAAASDGEAAPSSEPKAAVASEAPPRGRGRSVRQVEASPPEAEPTPPPAKPGIFARFMGLFRSKKD